MKYCILFIFLSISTSSFSQLSKKLQLKSKFLTFEKMRFSAGLNFNLGLARTEPSLKDLSAGSFFTAGLVFDIYSPLSSTGFTSGVNLKVLQYKFDEKVNDKSITVDSITLSTIEIPFFLRFKTGHVGAANRLVFMPGVAYNIPNEAKFESIYSDALRDEKIARNYFEYKFQLGWEILWGKKSQRRFNGKYVSDARTRVLIYGGVNYSRTPMYDSEYNQIPVHFENYFSELSRNNSINYYLGASIYFTLSQWEDIRDFLNEELENN